MSYRLVCLIIFILAAATVSADEFPRLGKACAQFRTPTGTAGVLFDRECKTAFILPPVAGEFKIESIAPSASVSQCGVIGSAVSAVSGQLTNHAAKISRAPIGPQRAAQCLRYIKAKAFLDGAAEIRQRQLADYRLQVVAAETALADCRKAASSPNECLLGELTLNTAKSQETALKITANSDAQLSSAVAAEVTQCGDVGKLEAATDIEVAEGEDRAKLIEILDEVWNISTKYHSVEGATLSVLLTADVAKLLKEAQQANPSFVVQHVPLSMALIMSANTKEGIQFPAALKVDVPLLPAMGRTFATTSTSPTQQAPTPQIFGPTASGYVTLSLPAACAANIGLGTNRAPEVRPYFAVNAVYKYPVEVGTKILVTANFDEIYKRIVENTSKGGLFRTSSSSKITDYTKSDDVIKVEFRSTEEISIEERSKLITQVKTEVVGRALDLVAREYVPGVGPLPLPSVQTSGAKEAARGLRENCAHQYCQVGAVVLDVAAAVFGGSSSISSFIKEKRISVTQEYDLNSTIYQYKTMGFQ